MKKLLNSGLALSLLVLSSLSVFADEELYITDTSGKFGTVDLSTDAVTVLGKSSVVLHDIGFTSNGDLYGNTGTSLYSVNIANGATTLLDGFGGKGNGVMVGLVGDGADLIGASYSTNKLYAIDVSPYSITTLSGTLNGISNGDLTFGPNGALYDVLTNGNLDKITISGTTITSTVVGYTGNKSVSGMFTDAGGEVFAISGTEIWAVDLNDAKLTPFLNYGGHGLGVVAGAAIFTAAVPEPSTVALLLAGMVGLAIYQKRRLATQS